MNLLHCAWREVVGRPRRTLFNALAVAIGVGLVISLFSVTLAYQKAITSPFTMAATNLVLSRPSKNNTQTTEAKGVILPSANQPISTVEIDRLTRISGAKRTAALLQLWSFDPGQFKVIAGLASDAPPIGPAKARVWVKKGRFYRPGESGVAVLETHFARFYGYKVGNQVKIAGRDFKVVGIYEVRQGAQLTAVNIYLPLTDAQKLAGVSSDVVNSVYLELKDASGWRYAVDAIHRSFPELAVTSADSALAMSESMLALLNKLAWPATGLVIAVCLFFVYRSLVASAWERVGEFGTMKAVGWQQRDIRRVLLFELFSQVVLGAFLGLALGALSAYLASLWHVRVSQVGQAPPLPGAAAAGAVIRLPALYPVALYLISFSGALAVGLFTAILIAARMAALKPAEAWRKL